MLGYRATCSKNRPGGFWAWDMLVTTLETWFGEEVRNVIRFLWAKHRIHYRLIEVNGYWLNRSASCQKMVEGTSTMKTAPPLGPAYGVWMWTQRQ